MEDAVYVRDGLVVFTREGIYQMRLKVAPQRYVYKSLKTRNKRDALDKARREFFKFEDRTEQGLAYISPTVKKVLLEYETHRTKENQQGRTKDGMLRQVKRVQKFWIEFIGDKQIDRIDNRDFENYETWRREYYSKRKTIPRNASLVPTDKTMQWETTFFKTVLKWATQKGYRGNKPMPTYSFRLENYRSRPAFEMQEHRKIIMVMRKRIRQATNPAWRYMREVLRDYVLVLANSGVRVGELNNLRIRDIHAFKDDKERENYRLIVRGKTGERDAIPRSGCKRYIDRALERRKAQGAKANDYLFVMYSGVKVTTLIDQFKEVLKEAELETSSSGAPYTLYSYRHHYAITALRKGKNVFEIARNMGTSVKIINLYYARTATSQTFATRLGD